jgi:hypothetical protein
VRAAVAQTDEHARIVEQLGHAVDARVERLHGEFIFEVIFQGQIEERIDAVLALGGGDLRHGFSFKFF